MPPTSRSPGGLPFLEPQPLIYELGPQQQLIAPSPPVETPLNQVWSLMSSEMDRLRAENVEQYQRLQQEAVEQRMRLQQEADEQRQRSQK